MTCAEYSWSPVNVGLMLIVLTVFVLLIIYLYRIYYASTPKVMEYERDPLLRVVDGGSI